MSDLQDNGHEQLIGVIDAGTRTITFGVFISQHIKEISEYSIDVEPVVPQEGWSEQDPLKILDAVKTCIKKVIANLGEKRAKKYNNNWNYQSEGNDYRLGQNNRKTTL